MQGFDVYNRHENCPYSLRCAVCDIEDEPKRAERISEIERGRDREER